MGQSLWFLTFAPSNSTFISILLLDTKLKAVFGVIFFNEDFNEALTLVVVTYFYYNSCFAGEFVVVFFILKGPDTYIINI